MIIVREDRVGCSARINKSTCHNRRTIRLAEMETRILKVLQEQLLPATRSQKPRVPLYGRMSTIVFPSSVAFLVYLMGWVGKGELLSALQTAGCESASA